MNRREFVASALATGVGVVGASGSFAGEHGTKMPVPAGRFFEGMSGAYSAMYTPFFRDGEKAGQLTETEYAAYEKRIDALGFIKKGEAAAALG